MPVPCADWTFTVQSLACTGDPTIYPGAISDFWDSPGSASPGCYSLSGSSSSTLVSQNRSCTSLFFRIYP